MLLGVPAQGSPVISKLSLDRTRVAVGDVATIRMDIATKAANMFDSTQIRVDGYVTPPNGRTWYMPGYAYRPHARKLVDGEEVVEPRGPTEWRVRILPMVTGTHRIVVRVRDSSGTVTSQAVTLKALPTSKPGLARVDPRDRRYIALDRGGAFFPVGANLCWAGKEGTFEYDRWLSAYARQGCNWFRLFLSLSWPTLSVKTKAAGIYGIDLAAAWRLDHVIGQAERLGMRAQMCFEVTTDLNDTASFGSFNTSLWNRANGGPLTDPTAFFTNTRAQQAYRDTLRYHVARWGGGRAVFAWEFMNEADLARDYDRLHPDILAWHSRMARYLRSVDPYRHLITSSLIRTEDTLHALPGLDFAQTHHYTTEDEITVFAAAFSRMPAAGKRPYFFGEFGVLKGTDRASDPLGVSLHNALWSSPGLGTAGTPMSWWWNGANEPSLYPLYGAFTRWIAGYDFGGQHPRMVKCRIDTKGSAIPGDMALEPDLESWTAGPHTGPVEITVDTDGGIKPSGVTPGILHGLVNHRDIRNPVTLHLNTTRPTRLVMLVSGVSYDGGARLSMRLDQQTPIEVDMPVPPGHPAGVIVNTYDREYPLDVPAGRHTVVVENTGKDWLQGKIVLRGYLDHAPSPLQAFGLIGRTEGMIWVRHRDWTWPLVTAGKKPEPVAGARLTLMNLPPGRWRIVRWDTTAGRPVATSFANADLSGRLAIALPTIASDAAYRIARAEQAAK